MVQESLMGFHLAAAAGAGVGHSLTISSKLNFFFIIITIWSASFASIID